jgi:glucose/arabinose dehydrogenase
MRALRPVAVALASLIVTSSAGAAASRAPAYAFERVLGGLQAPVYVTSAPGNPNVLYVVEQAGTIRTVQNGRATGTFLDIHDRVLSEGEHGLLSIAFHPRYAQNHLFYVDYTDLAGDTHIVEFRAENGVVDVASSRELLHVAQPYPNHKGGQLAFDRSGLLYVGMGDGGTNPAGGPRAVGDPENRAQNLESQLGKILRIDPTRPGAAWQIVGLGLRNPWRFSFDRLTGNLWIGDVGAAGNEEVDFRPKARIGRLANYGWSRFEGRLLYNRDVQLNPAGELVRPVWVYRHDHSTFPGPCGVIGGYVYRGKRAGSARGRYFFGDLCSGVVWSFKVGARGKASTVATVVGRVPSLSSFGEASDGTLYAVGLLGGLFVLR